jgi:hypothetical protein
MCTTPAESANQASPELLFRRAEFYDKLAKELVDAARGPVPAHSRAAWQEPFFSQRIKHHLECFALADEFKQEARRARATGRQLLKQGG